LREAADGAASIVKNRPGACRSLIQRKYIFHLFPPLQADWFLSADPQHSSPIYAIMLQHLKGIVCLGQGKRPGRGIVTGQTRLVQGGNGLGGNGHPPGCWR
jgi:hypothetical protein